MLPDLKASRRSGQSNYLVIKREASRLFGRRWSKTLKVQNQSRRKKKSKGQDANKVYKCWQKRKDLEQKPVCADIWLFHFALLEQK